MLYACHLRLILITIDETNQVDELCWVGGGVGGKGKALVVLGLPSYAVTKTEKNF